MSECKFCDALESHKKYVIVTNEVNKEHFPNRKKYYAEFTVALVIKTWYHGNKNSGGRTTDYKFRGNGYKLNFCPECGRKLNGK